MADKYDAIVIGSGLGGSVCAALLAKAGMKTLLLDKNNQPGGKSMGISVKGFRGEMWPTFGIPVEGGPFVEAFRQLGIESGTQFTQIAPYFIVFGRFARNGR